MREYFSHPSSKKILAKQIRTVKQRKHERNNFEFPSWINSTQSDSKELLSINIHDFPEFYHYNWPGSSTGNVEYYYLEPLMGTNGTFILTIYTKKPALFVPLRDFPKKLWDVNRFGNSIKLSRYYFKKRLKDPFIKINDLLFKLRFVNRADISDGSFLVLLDLI